MSSPTQVDIEILGRRFTIGTPVEEKARLEEAVTLLNDKIQAIQQYGKVTETEKILIMASLNLTHDFLKQKTEIEHLQWASAEHQEAERRVAEMNRWCRQVLELTE